MKTLGAWIAGIFALGVALGSFVSGSGARPEPAASELETALESAPPLHQVDCGQGREALLEPFDVDGTTSFKVRCVEINDARRTHVVSHPAPVVASAPPPPEIQVPEPAPTVDTVEIDDADDSRSWKQSAVVIGGAAGAGAGIGAMAKGKRGAAVGAAIGAASGAAYELFKRDKKN